MEELDKESIKYILCKAWRGHTWKYYVNNTKEFLLIDEDEMTNLLFSLGLFNKQDYFECKCCHTDFVFKDNKITPFLMNRNFTNKEMQQLIWGDFEDKIAEKRGVSSNIEQRYNNLFGKTHIDSDYRVYPSS